jgi:hypothetical protein
MTGSASRNAAIVRNAPEDGDTLVILESMKMEIPPEEVGTLAKLHVAEGTWSRSAISSRPSAEGLGCCGGARAGVPPCASPSAFTRSAQHPLTSRNHTARRSEAEPHWYSSRRSLRSWLAGLPLVVAGLGAVLVAPPPGGPVQRVPEVAQWRENQGGE